MAYGSGHNGCPFRAGHASNRCRNLYTMQAGRAEWAYLFGGGGGDRGRAIGRLGSMGSGWRVLADACHTYWQYAS